MTTEMSDNLPRYFVRYLVLATNINPVQTSLSLANSRSSHLLQAIVIFASNKLTNIRVLLTKAQINNVGGRSINMMYSLDLRRALATIPLNNTGGVAPQHHFPIVVSRRERRVQARFGSRTRVSHPILPLLPCVYATAEIVVTTHAWEGVER